MRRCAFLTMASLAGFACDDDLAYGPFREHGWDVDPVDWKRHDVDWRSGRHIQAIPDVGVDLPDADGFGKRGNLRCRARAFGTAGRKHIELARLDMGQRDVNRQEHDLELTAEQILHRARRSLVRNVHEVDAGR